MTCPHCDHEITLPVTPLFCPECGTRLPVDDE